MISNLKNSIEHIREIILDIPFRYYFNYQKFKELKTLIGHSNYVVRLLEIKEEGKRKLVSGSDSDKIRFWDISNGECLETLNISIRNCIIQMWNGKFAKDLGERLIKILNLFDDEYLKINSYGPKFVKCLIELNDLKITGTSFNENIQENIKVWSICDVKLLKILTGHTSKVKCFTKLRIGFFASGSSKDYTIKIWDVGSEICIKTFESSGVSCLIELENGDLVFGSKDSTIKILDGSNGRCLKILKGHHGEISCSTLLKNGKLACRSRDKLIKIWDRSRTSNLHEDSHLT